MATVGALAGIAVTQKTRLGVDAETKSSLEEHRNEIEALKRMQREAFHEASQFSVYMRRDGANIANDPYISLFPAKIRLSKPHPHPSCLVPVQILTLRAQGADGGARAGSGLSKLGTGAALLTGEISLAHGLQPRALRGPDGPGFAA